LTAVLDRDDIILAQSYADRIAVALANAEWEHLLLSRLTTIP
jgi:hypothetical protein